MVTNSNILTGRDANDRKEIMARWTVTTELYIETASQIGNHESDQSDQTFARSVDGKPILQGATLAGALRSALSDFFSGYYSDEPKEARELFGGWKDTQDIGTESPVILFDSIANNSEGSSIRDGVSISPISGIALDKHKYDREIALPGIVFPIRLDLIITNEMNENSILSMLALALQSLSKGDIRFGARKSRGMGQCFAKDFRAIRYDMSTAQGWKMYSVSDYELPCKGVVPKQEINVALQLAWSGYNPISYDDKRKLLTLEFNLNVDGTLIIRSPGRSAKDSDAIHLTEKGRAILSGTSIAGAIRSHANRLLNTIYNDSNKAISMCKELFGPLPDDVSSHGSKGSRVYVSESVIENTVSYRQSRVKIDRFTGGALDTALFEEQPSVGGAVKFKLTVREPTDGQIGLLLLVARDLIYGLLPIGGEASIGRGIFNGNVIVTTPTGEKLSLLDDISRLNAFVLALYEEEGDVE